MPKELELFGANGNAPLSLTELLINLVIALALAMIVRWHFVRFGSTLSNRDELGGVLPFLRLAAECVGLQTKETESPALLLLTSFVSHQQSGVQIHRRHR